jgi:hypothetical protein
VGWPVWLAVLKDSLLNDRRKKETFLIKLMDAVPAGFSEAQFTRVHHALVSDLLKELLKTVHRSEVQIHQLVQSVIGLYDRRLAGETATQEEWTKAAEAAFEFSNAHRNEAPSSLSSAVYCAALWASEEVEAYGK